MSHDCMQFQNDFASVLRTGEDLSPGALQAAQACPNCLMVLRSLAKVITNETAAPQPSATLEDRTVAAASKAARINASAGFILAILWIAFVNWRLDRFLSGHGMPSFTAHDLMRNILITVAVVWFGYRGIVRHDRGGRPPQLFSRMKNGRLFQGICVGLSEYFGGSVWLWRLGFIALFVAGFGGGPIYLLLDLALSRHPDDRESLLGFRLLRRLHA